MFSGEGPSLVLLETPVQQLDTVVVSASCLQLKACDADPAEADEVLVHFSEPEHLTVMLQRVSVHRVEEQRRLLSQLVSFAEYIINEARTLEQMAKFQRPPSGNDGARRCRHNDCCC
mmetsp:Transcript_48233/g.111816  ORF Transcript_48233/g.111816 Transcript_48233/m.111816 type:complete len:117 (-) Transcript_48233:97-447(-)